MREIKFRAWDKENQVMSHVSELDFIHEPSQGMDWGMQGCIDDIWLNSESESRIPNEVILLQYTGLKDIALKDEYDGDLVRDESGDIWKISMDDPRGTTYINLKTGEIIIAWEFLRVHVIIGNIYENPQILYVKG